MCSLARIILFYILKTRLEIYKGGPLSANVYVRKVDLNKSVETRLSN